MDLDESAGDHVVVMSDFTEEWLPSNEFSVIIKLSFNVFNSCMAARAFWVGGYDGNKFTKLQNMLYFILNVKYYMLN
uniref:Uncharacterized protein n=1 Tax=Glossina palpalis gambiensis TaxID=67801 RepID=A0A1B0AT86_9MUSC